MMEHFIDFIFMSLLLIGLGALIYGSQRSPSPRSRRSWRVTGLFLEGLAFVIFGGMTAFFTQVYPPQEVVGHIINLKQFTGKYPSSQFQVQSAQSLQHIHAEYNGSSIHEGELVRARFVPYNTTLLRLTVLDGKDAGWQVQESSGVVSCIVLVLIGIASFFGAWWEWKNTTKLQ